MVLDQKGNTVLLTRAPDLRQAQNTSNIKDIRIWVDKDDISPAEELKSILVESNLENKNLGVEYESYGLTGKNAMMLNHSLNNFAKLHDESFLISKILSSFLFPLILLLFVDFFVLSVLNFLEEFFFLKK